MRKYSAYFLSGLVVSLVVLGISSCGDDTPAVKPKLSFSESSMTVNEADGLIEVEIVLDKPAPEDVTISYELSGDAYDAIRADIEDELTDFEVVGEYEEVVIEKGETTGVIQLQLYADFLIEDSETIEIQITETDSERIEITRDDDIEITLEQEQDGLLVVLEWDETYTDVDMDELLRVADIGGNVATQSVAWGSVAGSTISGESIFIPKSIEDALYGLSYTYYSGTQEPMNFTVTMVEAIDGIFEAAEDRDVFNGQYTLANINAWIGNGSSTKVVQTFENVGGVFTNFSDISTPGSGSRVGTEGGISNTLVNEKLTKLSSAKLKSLLKSLKK
jgi:hypothetical protein